MGKRRKESREARERAEVEEDRAVHGEPDAVDSTETEEDVGG